MPAAFQTWKEAMKAWLKELIKWQEANPDKNWKDELCKATAADDEGSNPPPPPPPPPHG